MASPINKYAFINAKLRAKISKILSEEFLDQLLRSNSLVDAVGLFQNTDFSFIESIYTKTGDIKSIELELTNREIKLFLELESYSKDEVLRFVRALVNSFEIDNLKNTLRLWFQRVVRKRDIGTPYLYLYKKKIHNDLAIDAIIGSDSLEEIAAVLAGTPYSSIIQKVSGWVIEHNSIFRAEIALDKFFYKMLWDEISRLRGKDMEIAKRFVSCLIDIENIDWLIRFKTTYNMPLEEAVTYIIPYGCVITQEKALEVYRAQTVPEMLSGYLRKCYPSLDALFTGEPHEGPSRFLMLERVLRHVMMYEVARAKSGYPFTIGCVLAYFILKRSEIRNIVTILNARYYGTREETVKARL